MLLPEVKVGDTVYIEAFVIQTVPGKNIVIRVQPKNGDEMDSWAMFLKHVLLVEHPGEEEPQFVEYYHED